jgi:DNA-binding transcriptional MerR regulator
VRTFHYHEQIGLLVPSSRSDTGHRLYHDTDLARLYRICLLRRIGLPLAEIGQALDDPVWSLPTAVSGHLDQLDSRLQAIGRLRSRWPDCCRLPTPETANPPTSYSRPLRR